MRSNETFDLKAATLMITKPGAMSYQVIRSRPIRFLQPLLIFLIVNVIYFFLGFGDPLNTRLYPQMNNMPVHSEIATNIVQKKIKREHTSLKKFTEKYESR